MFLATTISSPGETLAGTATYSPCSGLWRQPVSMGHCHCFHSLSPIHVNHIWKHLESTSFLSPSLSHRRAYLPSRNLGSSLPMSTSFAALLRAAVMEEAISCPAGRRWRALGCSQPQQQAGAGGWGRTNVKAGESVGLQTCIRSQSSRRMHGYKNGIHYYSIN